MRLKRNIKTKLKIKIDDLVKVNYCDRYLCEGVVVELRTTGRPRPRLRSLDIRLTKDIKETCVLPLPQYMANGYTRGSRMLIVPREILEKL